MEAKVLSRRHFIQMAAVASGGILLMPGCANQAIKSLMRFFTDIEASLMDTIVEQIIPTDEWPGGKDAGVTNFIDKQLMGPYSRYQATYRNGLKAILETCKAKFQKKFEELQWEKQTQFLETMEAGKMEGELWKDELDSLFFGLINSHSMQGYYGSPRHGGNKDNISYQMLKLDYPVILGQNRYQN